MAKEVIRQVRTCLHCVEMLPLEVRVVVKEAYGGALMAGFGTCGVLLAGAAGGVGDRKSVV